MVLQPMWYRSENDTQRWNHVYGTFNQQMNCTQTMLSSNLSFEILYTSSNLAQFVNCFHDVVRFSARACAHFDPF